MSTRGDGQIPATIQTIKIIYAALIMGVLVFAGVVVFMKTGQGDPANAPNNPNAEEPIIAYAAVIFGVTAIMARVFVPPILAKGMRSQINREQFHKMSEDEQIASMIGMYQTKKIIEGAILEGAAFFGLIAVMMTDAAWAWAVPAVLVMAMLVGFPTQGGFENWARMQREMIEYEQ